MKTKKSRIKPWFKPLNWLRSNVQNWFKLFKLKRDKWELLKNSYKKKLRWYRKIIARDYSIQVTRDFATFGTSWKRYYRNRFLNNLRIRLFYGGMSKKEFWKSLFFLKKKWKQVCKELELAFLKFFEQRLDTVLLRAKFAKSFRDARQLVLHKKIRVNNIVIYAPNYTLKAGDIVTIDPLYNPLIHDNFNYLALTNTVKIKKLLWPGRLLWPMPGDHLLINYSTFEILFVGLKNAKFTTDFSFDFSVEYAISSFYL